MTITLPRVVQKPTPNYTPSLIAHDLVIAHMCEGGYAGSVAWLCDPRAQASAHLCMSEDGSEVTQLVPLQFKAWAQKAFNGKGVSLEIPGFTALGIPDDRWRAAANIVAWLCHAYAIPTTWARGGQGRGICQHVDLGAAGGGHHDCSPVGSDVWMRFLGYVQDAYSELGKAPLPPFALHGAPGPHEVELPATAAPQPSHGGAARDDGDVFDHRTPSTFPLHSVADLQWRLNRAGAAPPLVVDGFAGGLTRAALAAFQGRNKLFVDGLIGPMTWAAIDRVT